MLVALVVLIDVCCAEKMGCGCPERSAAANLHGPTDGVDTWARCPAHERQILEAGSLKRVAQSVQDVSSEASRECSSPLINLHR